MIPNHLFGIPADMEKIKEICKDKDIFIIEDAAQAMGGTYNGKNSAQLGMSVSSASAGARTSPAALAGL